jgi:hypothetical protein
MKPGRRVFVVESFKKSKMQISLCTHKIVFCRPGDPNPPRLGYPVLVSGGPLPVRGLRFFALPPPPQVGARNLAVPGWLIGTSEDEADANVDVTYTKVSVSVEAVVKAGKNKAATAADVDKSFVVSVPIVQSIVDIDAGTELIMHKVAEEKVVIGKTALNLSTQPAAKRSRN